MACLSPHDNTNVLFKLFQVRRLDYSKLALVALALVYSSSCSYKSINIIYVVCLLVFNFLFVGLYLFIYLYLHVCMFVCSFIYLIKVQQLYGRQQKKLTNSRIKKKTVEYTQHRTQHMGYGVTPAS